MTAELRYRGQSFELAVDCGEAPEPDALREAFAAAHERAYGYRDADGEVELVTLRVTATEPGPGDRRGRRGRRRAAARRGRRAAPGSTATEHEATVLTRRAGARHGARAARRSASCREATLAVPPGWAGARRAVGHDPAGAGGP